MSFIVGPTSWWVKSREVSDYYGRTCPTGTILPDGSAIWCKTSNAVWFVAPSNTQLTSAWAGGQYNTTLIGSSKTICCICEWPGLCTRLINCGFNPCDWFVPNQTTLLNSYFCRNNWDSDCSGVYWSSQELNSTNGCATSLDDSSQGGIPKCFSLRVRAFRCIST